jgi:hypothetical protein
VQTDVALRFKKRVTYVWKKPPQKQERKGKKFRDFSRDVFEKKNIEDTLGSNFI